MRVEDALRVPGGAARVAEPGRGAVVDLRVVVAARLVGDQLLVPDRARQRARVAVAHDDPVLHRLERRRHLLQHRHERVVDEHHLVLGVVRDVGQLLLEQTDVERVEHGAHAGHAHVRLEMPLRVPGERGDPVTVPHAKRLERAAQAVDPVANVGVARAGGAVVCERHHLAVAVHQAHAPEDVLQRERMVVLDEALEHARRVTPYGAP